MQYEVYENEFATSNQSNVGKIAKMKPINKQLMISQKIYMAERPLASSKKKKVPKVIVKADSNKRTTSKYLKSRSSKQKSKVNEK